MAVYPDKYYVSSVMPKCDVEDSVHITEVLQRPVEQLKVVMVTHMHSTMLVVLNYSQT
jgi:hypothetical protein